MPSARPFSSASLRKQRVRVRGSLNTHTHQLQRPTTSHCSTAQHSTSYPPGCEEWHDGMGVCKPFNSLPSTHLHLPLSPFLPFLLPFLPPSRPCARTRLLGSGPVGYAFQGLPPSASAMPPPQQQQQFAAPPQQPVQMQQQFAAPPAAAPMAASSAVPLENQGWYHGGIARPACEALLLGPACGPGAFCVRVSTRGDGAYSLSVREPMQMKVKHFKIERVGAQWKLSLKVPDNKIFGTIVQLIGHYQSMGNFSGISLAQAAPGGGAAPMPAAPAPAPVAAGNPCCASRKPSDKFCGICGTPNPSFAR